MSFACPYLVIILFYLFHINTAVEMTICNCQKPTLKGIIDFTDPNYCSINNPEISSVNGSYQLLTKNTIEWTTKGFLCMQWIKEKKVTGYFFGSYDTVFRTVAKEVSETECRASIQAPINVGKIRCYPIMVSILLNIRR